MAHRLLQATTGAVVVTGTTVGLAVALYYFWLPKDPGPDNASPPPEGLGAMLGAFLGCALGVALLALLYRDFVVPVLAWSTSIAVGCFAWLVFGTDSLGSRAVEGAFAVVVLGLAGALGLGVGRGAAELLSAWRGHPPGSGTDLTARS